MPFLPHKASGEFQMGLIDDDTRRHIMDANDPSIRLCGAPSLPEVDRYEDGDAMVRIIGEARCEVCYTRFRERAAAILRSDYNSEILRHYKVDRTPWAIQRFDRERRAAAKKERENAD